MLPCQLAPYCQYTVESMIRVLLFVHAVHAEDGRGVLTALGELAGEHDVLPWLVAYWRGLVLRGLRRAHPVLALRYDISGIHAATDSAGQLEEIHAYCAAFEPRGPPGRQGLRLALQRYSQETKRHLVGTPSQER